MQGDRNQNQNWSNLLQVTQLSDETPLELKSFFPQLYFFFWNVIS